MPAAPRGAFGYAAMGARQRLRYRFDNLMSRGVGAQILLLAIVSAVLVLITAVAVIAFGVVPTDDKGEPDSFGRILWKTLMHMFDAGNLGGNTSKLDPEDGDDTAVFRGTMLDFRFFGGAGDDTAVWFVD